MKKIYQLIQVSLLIILAFISYQCGEIEADPNLTKDLIGQYIGVSQLKTAQNSSLNDTVDGTIPEADSINVNVVKNTDISVDIFVITNGENDIAFKANLEQASDGIALLIDSGATGYVTNENDTPGWHGAFQVENNRLVFSINEKQVNDTTARVKLYSATKQQE